MAGGFEQKNIVTVTKILRKYFGRERKLDRFLDLTHVREGQDIRYALNDDKLRSFGWEPNKIFDVEIGSIVEYYKHNFKW